MKENRRVSLRLRVLVLLLAFALCLTLTNMVTVSVFSERYTDQYASSLSYLLRPMMDLLDSYYLNSIDRPMEAEIASTPYISYSFTTPRYPANPDLQERIQYDLQTLSDSAEAIHGAFAYSTATDSYLASASLLDENSPLPDPTANLRDIIYNYNTGALPRSPLSSSEHLTFLFQYHDLFLISKELTPTSGLAVSTLFLVLNMEGFSSYVMSAGLNGAYYGTGIEYGIYDSTGRSIFQSNDQITEMAQIILHRASEASEIVKMDQVYGVSFRSEVTNWQYIFLVDHHFLSPLAQALQHRGLIFINAGITLLFILIFLLVLRRMGRRYDAPLAGIAERLKISQSLPARDPMRFFQQAEHQIAAQTAEKEELQNAISQIAPEAVSMLFFRMLSGANVNTRYLELALQYTGHGFATSDIYVAGVASYLGDPQMDIAKRYQMTDILAQSIEKYHGRVTFHHTVLTLDMPFFAIVLSFPQDTSIARGRRVTDELSQFLVNALKMAGYPVSVSFGHLYHSIHDLPFSYHEAMKLQYPREEIDLSGMDMEETEVSPEPAPPDQEAAEAPSPAEYDSFIDRRAGQVVRLVQEDKMDAMQRMLERTLATIDSWQIGEDRSRYALQLVRVVTEAMTSQGTIPPDQLTDVYSPLAERNRQGVTVTEALEGAHHGILTLCEDFHRAQERRNNPYITGTLDYIQSHYQDPALSLEEIAESLKIAPNYLSSLFSKTLGKKLFEYVNEVRVRQATELLAQTRLTVNEISEKSGFGSSRNFIRVFKKYTDTTPTAYRRQQLGENDSKEMEE